MKLKEGDKVVHKQYGNGVIVKLDCVIRGLKRWVVKFESNPFPFDPAIWHDELKKLK